jgi:hypothetical protein
MLVFRDSRRLVSSQELLSELTRAVARAHEEPLTALLLAAEVECALEDGAHEGAPVARQLSDALADSWLGLRQLVTPLAHELVMRLSLPERLELKCAEGFAFYALEPAAYARAAARLRGPRDVCVVGVRTIGTSLSAIVRASLVHSGVPARRLTVRPSGHPWARVLELGPAEREFVERGAPACDFVVVDEGPGRSGSTFLAVAEALERHGVPPARIRLLASHAIEAERLVAEDAPRRFARFGCEVVEPWSPPPGAVDLSGGAWRSHVDLGAWPPCWQMHERVKYLEADASRLHKFSGLSRYGAGVLERASLLAEAGLAPRVEQAEAGWLAYPWLAGRPAQSRFDGARAVEVLARYLAFRTAEIAGPAPPRGEIEAMARLNAEEGTGARVPDDFELEVVRPVVCDGHMMPHEWLVVHDGFVKTDGAEHGDDHFYPGPVDIAWDVAGTVVEWTLAPELEHALVRRYTELTGDDVRPRLDSYKLAYSALRLGVADFAERDAQDEDERSRWNAAKRHYAARVRHAVGRVTPA